MFHFIQFIYLLVCRYTILSIRIRSVRQNEFPSTDDMKKVIHYISFSGNLFYAFLILD